MNDKWQVYILSCSDGTLYTGITVNLPKRIAEHNSSSGGAKYTVGRRPVELVYSEPATSRSEASRREYQIKKMSRSAKIVLISERDRSNCQSLEIAELPKYRG